MIPLVLLLMKRLKFFKKEKGMIKDYGIKHSTEAVGAGK